MERWRGYKPLDPELREPLHKREKRDYPRHDQEEPEGTGDTRNRVMEANSA